MDLNLNIILVYHYELPFVCRDFSLIPIYQFLKHSRFQKKQLVVSLIQ